MFCLSKCYKTKTPSPQPSSSCSSITAVIKSLQLRSPRWHPLSIPPVAQRRIRIDVSKRRSTRGCTLELRCVARREIDLLRGWFMGVARYSEGLSVGKARFDSPVTLNCWVADGPRECVITGIGHYSRISSEWFDIGPSLASGKSVDGSSLNWRRTEGRRVCVMASQEEWILEWL